MKLDPNPSKGIFLRRNIYWLRFSVNGKQRFVTLQTNDPAEAVTRAIKARGMKEFAPKTGLEAEVGQFVLSKKMRGKFTSRQTEMWAVRALGRLVDFFGKKSVSELTASDMQNFSKHLQKTMAETGAMSYLRCINSFFSWSIGEHMRYENPCKGLVHEPANAARLLFATKEQRDGLINALTDKQESLKFIFFCAFHAGMRFHEIIEARPYWFNLEGGYIGIQNTDTFKTKNRCSRTVPLSSPFQKFLKKYKLRSPFMLEPDVTQGRSIYRYDFRRPWTDHCEAQGLAWITPHVARHTFASLLVQSGESIYKVAKWMGHGVGVCEKHYAHLAPGDSGIDKML